MSEFTDQLRALFESKNYVEAGVEIQSLNPDQQRERMLDLDGKTMFKDVLESRDSRAVLILFGLDESVLPDLIRSSVLGDLSRREITGPSEKILALQNAQLRKEVVANFIAAESSRDYFEAQTICSSIPNLNQQKIFFRDLEDYFEIKERVLGGGGPDYDSKIHSFSLMLSCADVELVRDEVGHLAADRLLTHFILDGRSQAGFGRVVSNNKMDVVEAVLSAVNPRVRGDVVEPVLLNIGNEFEGSDEDLSQMLSCMFSYLEEEEKRHTISGHACYEGLINMAQNDQLESVKTILSISEGEIREGLINAVEMHGFAERELPAELQEFISGLLPAEESEEYETDSSIGSEYSSEDEAETILGKRDRNDDSDEESGPGEEIIPTAKRRLDSNNQTRGNDSDNSR